jgi:hypothetical protein
MERIDGIDIPLEPVGCVVVQSKLMTQAESAVWVKFLQEFAPDGFFQYVTWVPEQPVN